MENKENEVGLTKLAMMDDSRVHSTPIAIKESSLTDSAIMDDSGVQSTPVSIKESSESDYKMIKMLQSILNVKFDEQSVKFESKFNEQNVKFDEVRGDMNLSLIHI